MSEPDKIKVKFLDAIIELEVIHFMQFDRSQHKHDWKYNTDDYKFECWVTDDEPNRTYDTDLCSYVIIPEVEIIE